MNTKLHGQIHSNLNIRNTEELIEIWKTNDHVEWSDLTFEVLEEILKERLGTLPEQNPPILEKETNEELEAWEVNILDSKEQPKLYDTLEVIDLIDNINKVAKVAAVIYLVAALLSSYAFEAFYKGVISTSSTMEEWMAVLGNLVTVIAYAAINAAFVYFPLKALTHILRILMEMEFNSRKTNDVK
ncbi:MAG TPA: hypothetical protein PK078_04685 [Anaerolineales bacterium]|nr:hypothetical protein [Anaerolineales bacterium]HNA88662.1 hypothetical protein [Anaerolineales bacterium]HNB35906.1 hypothetical protein [Anaerolineales bacterium]HNC07377.1 hypothetical protein [Anaerolineales bacterium]